MTIFGPDISSFQHGVDVSALSDPFVMLKCTEGTYYVDADYPHWLAQARASKKLVVAYHFISGEDPHKQAAHLMAHIGDHSIPIMIDWEPEGSFHPSVAQLLALIDALIAAGGRVRLAYVPRWYWSQVGSPSLAGLGTRGVGVVSSAYGPAGLPPAQGYRASGGDTGNGWTGYGGMFPVLWQYTDSGLEQQRLDFNAYRGTIDQLAALMNGDTNVSGYTMTAGWQSDYPDVAAALRQHIPVGLEIDTDHAAAYAMIRSFVTAERTALIEDKLDRLLAASVTVDTAGIANQVTAAIVQHLAAGVDVQAVAVAVQAQLAQALGGHAAG